MKELLQRATKINEELVAKLKELKELEELTLLGADGKYFTCEIDGGKTKGRITVEDIGVYLCQNKLDGLGCKEKYGYNYSYFIRKGTEDVLESVGIKNFKLWDYLPNEGEYFYVKTKGVYAFIAIAKNGENLTSRFASLDQDSEQLNYDESGCVCSELFIEELRPATPQEIAFLDTKLKENGKYFDQESMSIKDIEKEPAFKRGDWVLITKPKDVRQKPYWLSYMDEYGGQTLEIEGFNSDGYLVIDSWKFHPDWCKKVGAQKSFKVGDWVLITKPKDVTQSPYWSYYMDEYDGQTVKIDEINSDNYLDIDDWNFHPDWCTKVEVSESTFKVGDRCILWNEDKSDAITGKLTKINYESDFPYEAIDILVYKNCIKFESMEQYNKFIEE